MTWSRWFAPYWEQTGSQQGRGCMEHIVTLTLTSLTLPIGWNKSNITVYFINCSLAHDRVPRASFFGMLRELPCWRHWYLVPGAWCLVVVYTVRLIGTATVEWLLCARTCVTLSLGSRHALSSIVLSKQSKLLFQRLWKKRINMPRFNLWELRICHFLFTY